MTVPQRKPPERRFRRGPGESLAGLLARVDALLADSVVGQLATPEELERTLFAGAALHHPDAAVVARFAAVEDGSVLGDDRPGLPRRLGEIASAFFREGNVDLAVHRGLPGLRLTRVPLDREAVGGDGLRRLRLARLERLVDGSGRPVAALALPPFEAAEALRDRMRRATGRERGVDRALFARLAEQLLQAVGYRAGATGEPPRLERSAAVALAWETTTVFREVVLEAVAADLRAPVPDVRVPLLLGR